MFTLYSCVSCSYHNHFTLDKSHHTSPTCFSAHGDADVETDGFTAELYTAGSKVVLMLISLSANPGIRPFIGS